MSVASYPILKFKPRPNFYLSVFFFLFNVFLYIHEYAMRSFVYSSMGQRAISELLFGTMFGCPGLWQLIIGYFVGQTTLVFYYF